MKISVFPCSKCLTTAHTPILSEWLSRWTGLRQLSSWPSCTCCRAMHPCETDITLPRLLWPSPPSNSFYLHHYTGWLVGRSLTSLFSRNMAILETIHRHTTLHLISIIFILHTPRPPHSTHSCHQTDWFKSKLLSQLCTFPSLTVSPHICLIVFISFYLT